MATRTKLFFLLVLFGICVVLANDYTPSLYIQCNKEVISDYKDATFSFIDSKDHANGFKEAGDFKQSGSIKLRGNSTATSPKKPYAIKFDKKVNILGMGKAKKWNLLSNPFDPALIRNKLILDLAGKLPFIYTPKSHYVDVWFNGTFMGNYLLTQKIDFSAATIPFDVDDGDFLFEYVTERKKKDVSYFKSPISNYRFALKEPEKTSKAQRQDLLIKLSVFESAISSQNINEYIRYIDLLSIIDQYWIEEFVHDSDINTGSVFFTIHDGILRGGPVWDFDLSMGNTRSQAKAATTGIHNREFWWGELFADPIFEKIANERYLELAPYFKNLAEDNELGKNQIDELMRNFKESFQSNFSDSGWVHCNADINDNSKSRQLTCPYNPEPKESLEENIEDLREWILTRNRYLVSKAKSALEQLDSIDITLSEVLELQEKAFSEERIFPKRLRKKEPVYSISFLRANNHKTTKQILENSILINGKKHRSKHSNVIIKK